MGQEVFILIVQRCISGIWGFIQLVVFLALLLANNKYEIQEL